jgi:predicted TIM-barrel fold metal-dependent hydrolase
MLASHHPAGYGRIHRPDLDWLAQRAPEPTFEPNLPIVDAHHHLWRKPGYAYELPDLLSDIGTGHDIVATIHVECGSGYLIEGPEEMRPVGETAQLVAMTAQAPKVAAGIVAFADLTRGDGVAPVLEAHVAAGCGRLRGIRQQATWDDDPAIGHGAPCPHLLLRDDFRAGLGRLAPLGLAFDLWVFHPQLDEALDIARAFPATTFILGHCGGQLGYGRYSGRHEEVSTQWKAGMAALARCPNVLLKLGGLTMRLAAFDYGPPSAPLGSAELAAAWAPTIHTCIELFGAERCMFESNFPVEKMGVGYGTLWNTFKRLAAGASDDEKLALFSATARRAYRLSSS